MSQVVPQSSANAVSSSQTLTITKPSGLALGDLMIANITISAATITSVPSGWTQLQAIGATISYYKIADAGDVAASNFSWGNNDVGGTGCFEGGIIRFTGHDPVNWQGTMSATANAGTGTAPTTPGITPTTQPLLVMFTSHQSNTNACTVATYAVAVSNPSWTETWDQNQNPHGTRIGDSAATATWAGTAGTSTGTGSAAFSLTQSSWDMQLISIYPPPVVMTPLIVTTAENDPVRIFTRIMTSLIVTATLPAVITSLVASMWRNTAKNVASWHNTNKS